LQLENGHQLLSLAPTSAHLDNRLSRWTKPGSARARYAARRLSAKNRSFLARDQPQGLSPSGTINAVRILR
jgi:hypothetical protein